MGKPLDGLKVVDLTRVLSGPYCTMLLADMGADVVKVERPGIGDDGRALGPPFVAGESAYFLSVNRNKRSVTIDLKHPEGVSLIRRLLAVADVVVENFRPGTMASLGLGYDTMRDRNPRIVFCSISGYGQTGPDASLPGYDLIIQGEGGVMSLTGDLDGPPYKCGASQADIIAGVMGFQGILLALLARERTGRGQHIDISMLDCQVSLLAYHAGIYFATGANPSRRGNQHPTVAPYGTYPCQDGNLALACGNDAMWEDFCRAVERTEWARDARFHTNADRVRHRDTIDTLIATLFRTRPCREWVATLRAHGVPCGPIRTVAEACENPHIHARNMVVALDHTTVGPMQVTGIPIKLSETPGSISVPPPLLGEHTARVLREWLNMDDADIETLRTARVV